MSLIIRIINAKITNKLIDKKIYYKFDIKTTQFYNTNYKIQQSLKYQIYEHKIYDCKSNQKCVYCAQNYRSKYCSHK